MNVDKCDSSGVPKQTLTKVDNHLTKYIQLNPLTIDYLLGFLTNTTFKKNIVKCLIVLMFWRVLIKKEAKTKLGHYLSESE